MYSRLQPRTSTRRTRLALDKTQAWQSIDVFAENANLQSNLRSILAMHNIRARSSVISSPVSFEGISHGFSRPALHCRLVRIIIVSKEQCVYL